MIKYTCSGWKSLIAPPCSISSDVRKKEKRSQERKGKEEFFVLSFINYKQLLKGKETDPKEKILSQKISLIKETILLKMPRPKGMPPKRTRSTQEKTTISLVY